MVENTAWRAIASLNEYCEMLGKSIQEHKFERKLFKLFQLDEEG